MRIIFGVACMVMSTAIVGAELSVDKQLLTIDGYANITGNIYRTEISHFGGATRIKACVGGWIRIYITENGRAIYTQDASLDGINEFHFRDFDSSFVGRKVTVNYEFHGVTCTLNAYYDSDFFGPWIKPVERKWSGMSNVSFDAQGRLVWKGDARIRSSVQVADILELKLGQCSEIYSNVIGPGLVSMDVPKFITNPRGGRLDVRVQGRTLCLDPPAVKPNGGKYQGMMRVSLRIP